MTTSKTRKITSPFRQDGWILISIAIASILDLSSSFSVPQHSSLALDSFGSDGRRCLGSQIKDHHIYRGTSLLFSTAQDEDLLASVEDGTLDIDALEEMFGEDFNFDDLEDEEVIGEKEENDDGVVDHVEDLHYDEDDEEELEECKSST